MKLKVTVKFRKLKKNTAEKESIKLAIDPIRFDGVSDERGGRSSRKENNKPGAIWHQIVAPSDDASHRTA